MQLLFQLQWGAVTRTMYVALLLRNNWSKRHVQLSEPNSTSLLLIYSGLSWGSSTTSHLLISPGPVNECLTSSWEDSSPPSSWSRLDSVEDKPLVEFMCLVFTRMPGESYRRRLRSLLLYLCDVFRALIISLVCGVVPRTETRYILVHHHHHHPRDS